MTQFTWTPAQDASLTTLRGDGQSWEAIGAALRRSSKTCAARARELGITAAAAPRPWQLKRRFSVEDDEAIKRGRADGWTWDQLGVLLGCNGKTVCSHAVRELGLPTYLPGKEAPAHWRPPEPRVPMPAGHPVSWGALTAGTLLEGEEWKGCE